jgi:hypothetical protein
MGRNDLTHGLASDQQRTDRARTARIEGALYPVFSRTAAAHISGPLFQGRR